MAARKFYARVVRVVDGDSVYLECDTGFHNTHTDNFRLLGIDAPERDPASRQALAEMLATYANGWFEVTVHKADKYGRWLVEIPMHDGSDKTINEHMVEEGFAQSYDGGVR